MAAGHPVGAALPTADFHLQICREADPLCWRRAVSQRASTESAHSAVHILFSYMAPRPPGGETNSRDFQKLMCSKCGLEAFCS